jgi:hypothetical protein
VGSLEPGLAAPAGGSFGTGLLPGTSISGLNGPAAAMGFGGALGGSTAGISSLEGGAGSVASDAPTAAGSGLNDIMSSSSGGFGTGLQAGTSTSGLTANPVSSLSGLNSSSVLGTPTTATPAITSPESFAGAAGSNAGGASGINLGDGGYSLEGGQGGQAMGGQFNPAAMGAPAGGSDIGSGLQAVNPGGGSPNIPMMGSDSGGFGTGLTNNNTGFGLTAPGGATGAKAMGGGFGDFLQQNGPGLMKLFQSGLGAYQNYTKQRAYDNYVNQINDLYSPNSPYAQQMAETLGRQDAAAGRNSQYGTRATQLAAALTEARSRALSSNPYFSAATATPGASMLNTLFANFNTPQGLQQLGQLGTGAFNGLSSLFSGF